MPKTKVPEGWVPLGSDPYLLLPGSETAIPLSGSLSHHLPPYLLPNFFTRMAVTGWQLTGPTLITSIKILIWLTDVTGLSGHPIAGSTFLQVSVRVFLEELSIWIGLVKDYFKNNIICNHFIHQFKQKKKEGQRVNLLLFAWFGASIFFLNISAPGSQTWGFRLGLTLY